MRTFNGALAGLAILMAGGCAVGPNYKRPVVGEPAQFRFAAGTNHYSLAEMKWWELYQDPGLQSLIRVALTNNFDIRAGLTLIEQSRAVAMQARAQLLPSAGYQAGAATGHNAFLGNPSPQAGRTDSYLGALNAAWEVDLWGRVRRMNESAQAQYLAAQETQRGVQLSIVGQVAQAYFELLQLDAQHQIAMNTSNSFFRSYQIFSQQRQGGVASRLETSRAEAALASAASTVPDLERQIGMKENQISILLGRNPGPVPRTTHLLEVKFAPEIPVGLPSSLLERRPDLCAAEQQVRSANAQIGVAVGNFFPKIGLTALYGGVSPELSALTSGGASLWSVGANITGPIFQGGSLVGKYKEAKAQCDQARLSYQMTAQTAFREVADALIAREKLEHVRSEQARCVRALSDAVEVSMQRYVAGKANYYEVLEAQQQLFPAEVALSQTQMYQLQAVVQLYMALGGGWEMEPVAKLAGK
jgi:multidrug efflux system outer membrane protein